MEDNRTLDEIRDQHADNIDYLLKKSTERIFVNLSDARVYRMQLLSKALGKLGVQVESAMKFAATSGSAASHIDDQLKAHNVRVENHQMDHLPMERRGMYIYKENELVTFISLIKRIFQGDRERFTIVSNLML